MLLRQTPELSRILRLAADNPNLKEELRVAASEEHCRTEHVEYKRAAAVFKALRGIDQVNGPYLHLACQSGGLVLPSPAAREKSPQLKARLAQLQHDLDNKKYAALVHDITKEEREIAARAENSLVTYKDQLGFGVHVLVMMGTLCAVGYVAGRSLSPKPVYHAVGGFMGLVFAMLLEATLYVIRTGTTPPTSVQAALAQERKDLRRAQESKKAQ